MDVEHATNAAAPTPDVCDELDRCVHWDAMALQEFATNDDHETSHESTYKGYVVIAGPRPAKGHAVGFVLNARYCIIRTGFHDRCAALLLHVDTGARSKGDSTYLQLLNAHAPSPINHEADETDVMWTRVAANAQMYRPTGTRHDDAGADAPPDRTRRTHDNPRTTPT